MDAWRPTSEILCTYGGIENCVTIEWFFALEDNKIVFKWPLLPKVCRLL